MNLKPLAATNVLFTQLSVEWLNTRQNREVRDWVNSSAETEHKTFSTDHCSSDKLGSDYPWRIKTAAFNGKWLQEGFKDLEAYAVILNLLSVKSDWVKDLIFLQTDTTPGPKFWHNDPDILGLRFYVDRADSDLLLVKQNPVRSSFIPSVGSLVQDVSEYGETQTCAFGKEGPSVYFLNNFNAVHSINVGQISKPRLAGFVTVQDKYVEQVQEMYVKTVEDSALKYKPVLWKNPTTS